MVGFFLGGGGAAFQKFPGLPELQSRGPRAPCRPSMQPVQAPLQPGFWTHPCLSWCEGGLGLNVKVYSGQPVWAGPLQAPGFIPTIPLSIGPSLELHVAMISETDDVTTLLMS